MQFVLLFSILLIGAANGQLSGSRDQECKDNESFNSCGTACEPSCENPNPSFCTLQCVIGCQCEKGFLRRSDKKCVKQEDCKVATPQILPAPTPTCPANEFANECHNPCTEKKCPVKNAPLVNCLMACTNGCSCQKGYLRNNKGQCVKEADCPPIDNSEDQCNLVDCATGLKCAIQNGKPTCIPASTDPNLPPTLTCANIRCGSRGGCGMVEPVNCPECKRGPSCLQVNNCNKKQCKATEECVLVQVTCVKAPCNPIAECRPIRKPKPLTLPRETRQTTGPSCDNVRCSTKAGCLMIKPMSCGGKKDCPDPEKPVCVDENPCLATTCLSGTICVLHEVQCIKAPCPPIAQCEAPPRASAPEDKRCNKNERFTGCLTACSDVKCNEEPRSCPQVCNGNSGCVCQDGFFRDKTGKCVTQNECDIQKPKPLTQPREPRQTTGPSCDNVRCSTKAGCLMIKPMSCGDKKDCPEKPTCVDENPCIATTCFGGTICVLHEVQCIKAPCPPIAQCEDSPRAPAPGDGRCGKNERMAGCLTACFDLKCNEHPRACPQVCNGNSGCVCQEGFFRDKTGNCVTQNECDIQKQGNVH